MSPPKKIKAFTGKNAYNGTVYSTWIIHKKKGVLLLLNSR